MELKFPVPEQPDNRSEAVREVVINELARVFPMCVISIIYRLLTK